jgi:Cro/C1-type HTH DNA-binding domain
MKKSGDGTYRPRVKTIERLMRENGVSRTGMPQKIKISPATVRSLLDGKPAYMATFVKIADLFGVKTGDIIEDEAVETPPPLKGSKDRRKGAVAIARGFDSFDEVKELPGLIEAIRNQIGANYKIYVIAIGPGSVVVTLNLHVDDAERLQAAFDAGRLTALSITRVYLYPPEKQATGEEAPIARRKFVPDEKKGKGNAGMALPPGWLLRWAVAACVLIAATVYLKPWRWLGQQQQIVTKEPPQPVPGLPTAQLLAKIDSLRISDGPFAGGFRLQENDGRLNWYFCNLGLLPLCDKEPATVVAYLNLYLKNTDPARGTIEDVREIASGVRQPPDSDDSYAATFLTLASRYYQATDDQVWWEGHAPRLKQIAKQVLLAAQKPSGLVANFVGQPERAVGFLMDNSEVYRGLSDFSGQLARSKDAEATVFSDAAARVAKGIAGLYDPKTQSFQVADIPAATTFYPLRTAQVFPEVFGVPFGDAAETQRIYAAAWAFLNAGGDHWETGQVADGSLGGYPWMVLSFASAKHGDAARARAQLAFFSNELKKPAPIPQFTAANELAWAAMTRAKLTADAR